MLYAEVQIVVTDPMLDLDVCSAVRKGFAKLAI
jgi:hypothetical protein